MPPKVSTRSKTAAPAAEANAPAASSSGTSAVRFQDPATIDPDYDPDFVDEDMDMEEVAGMSATNNNEEELPSTPGHLPEEDDDDLNDESNTDNPVESDEELLFNLHLEREVRVSQWEALVRKMAKGQATVSEAEAAEAKVSDVDKQIAMMMKIGANAQSPQEEPTDKPETKGKTEQLVLKIPKNMPHFKRNDNARTFLVELKDIITAYAGRERFEQDCARYLSYAIHSDFRRQLDDELEARQGDKITWKELEAMFLRMVMPVKDRMEEIRGIIALGRRSNETYRQFALRIHHDVTLLGIKDDNEVIIDSLQDKVPDGVFNDMLITLRIAKQSRCRFTSIKDFTDILSDMAGPTVDIGKQHAVADEHSPRPANRPNRGTSNGVNRNRTFGRHRFDPNRRGPTQPASTMHQAAPTSRIRKHCNNCGPNNTHSTEECVQCSYCHKKGHTAD
ncbi:hypothetical protein EC968_009597, partial [Mortierella alpina]